jgi:hypothetical protein
MYSGEYLELLEGKCEVENIAQQETLWSNLVLAG